MPELKKGYIQIYTGNGKGKSTAAIGQAVRAAGFGLNSYILMLMKEYPYNEIKALKRLSDNITVVQACKDDFVYTHSEPPKEEVEKAKQALAAAKEKMLSGEYDLIILDEVCVAIYFTLITVKDVLTLLKEKPGNVELILTGRYCPEEFIELADLVTEMKEVKHYYEKGVISRRGIES